MASEAAPGAESVVTMDQGRGVNDQTVQRVVPASWKELRSRFKVRRGELPSMEGVADFTAAFLGQQFEAGGGWVPVPSTCRDGTGYAGPMFGLRDHPGFVHCPGALSPAAQLQLAHCALEKYRHPPHETNIDSHRHRPVEKQPALAWASLGYQFDWTHRTYREEKKSPFPPELAALSAHFARAVQPPERKGFTAQAAIVNYYTPGRNMGKALRVVPERSGHACARWEVASPRPHLSVVAVRVCL